MLRLVTLRMALSLMLSLPALAFEAHAQGVLEHLKRLEQLQAESTKPRRDLTIGEICALFEKDSQAPKCRAHYVGANYRVEWSGIDGNSSHPARIEILVIGDKAVACISQAEFPPGDAWPCIPLQRSN